MSPGPIPILMVCVIVYSAQVLLIGLDVVEPDLPSCEFGDGFLGQLEGIADCLWAGVELIALGVSFQLVEMPWYLAAPLSLVCGGSLVWQLVRVAAAARGGSLA